MGIDVDRYKRRGGKRLTAVQSLLVRLGRQGSAKDLRLLKAHFHWFAGTGEMYGFPKIAQFADEAERECASVIDGNSAAADIFKLNRLAGEILKEIVCE